LTTHIVVQYKPQMVDGSDTNSWATPLREHAAGRLMGNTVVSFEEEESKLGKTVRMPVDEWNELAEALQFEKNLRRAAGLKGKFSMNDLITQLVRWARVQYWVENGPKPDKMNDREAVLRALDARLKAAAADREGGKKK
jgi:hypothetical protein